MRKTALIAMSGGVDSSAAALILQQQGWDCTGITMQLHRENALCGTSSDAEDAAAVAEKLGMPFHTLDATGDFAHEVMDHFVAEYRAGRTPNPCIRCNRCMKFGRLMEEREKLGCDILATGHYARVAYDPQRQRWLLKRAKNTAKDQTYVLYFLSQEQLAHLCFPLGEFESKDDIRNIAAERDLITARKKDSQDICFVPDGDYVRFLRQYGGVKLVPGNFVDRSGNVLGRHKGLEAYTTGQRKGLGVSSDRRLYVLSKNAENRTVLLGDDEELFTSTLIADNVNWIAIARPDAPVRVTAKTRYTQKESAATVEPLADGRVRVVFDEPQRAITAGQAVVFYEGENVIGGGTITEI